MSGQHITVLYINIEQAGVVRAVESIADVLSRNHHPEAVPSAYRPRSFVWGRRAAVDPARVQKIATPAAYIKA